MALASGFGHGMGMGFGLGFLNFIGTILFIIAVIWVIKLVARGFRGCAYDDGNDPGRGDWGGRGGPGGFGHGFGPYGRHGMREHRRHRGQWHGGAYGNRRDEALEVARERLARGQIDAAEYERLRSGLGAGTAGEPNSADGANYPGSRGAGRPRRDQALEIARMRFATGELTSEEFDSVKRALDA